MLQKYVDFAETKLASLVGHVPSAQMQRRILIKYPNSIQLIQTVRCIQLIFNLDDLAKNDHFMLLVGSQLVDYGSYVARTW